MPIAIVNFRTMANGSYRYMGGRRRGYWRLMLVADPDGPTCIHSRNVLQVIAQSPEGIDGVTSKSRYYLGDYRNALLDRADEINAAAGTSVSC